MRKFVIHSFRGATTIMEVECEVLSRHMFTLKEGEWMGKITAPESLFEKQGDGSLKPPVWCWWAFHETAEECMVKIEQDARSTIERARHKMGLRSDTPVVPLTPEELEVEITETLSKVQVVRL
jgi:hypothetical protein